jgi:hypothetical protein
MAPGDLGEPIHPRDAADEVHGEDGAPTRRDRRLDDFRVDVVRDAIDVGTHGHCPVNETGIHVAMAVYAER